MNVNFQKLYTTVKKELDPDTTMESHSSLKSLNWNITQNNVFFYRQKVLNVDFVLRAWKQVESMCPKQVSVYTLFVKWSPSFRKLIEIRYLCKSDSGSYRLG